MTIFSRASALSAVSTLVLSGALLTPVAASAQIIEDIYISGSIGAALPSDTGFSGVQSPGAGVPGVPGGAAEIEAEFDTDIQYGAAIGGSWPDRFSFGPLKPRSEIEVTYFDADVDGGQFNGGNQTFSGDLSALSVYVNNYFDFKTNPNARLVPYMGGGFGFADVDANIDYFPNNGVASAPTFGVRNASTEFTSHFTGGLTYKATDRTELFAQGRYYTIYDVNAERRFIAGGNDGFSAAVEDNLDGFNVSTGLRFKF